MKQRMMYVYPWDLLEEGAARVVDNLRSAGLNAISLAASYHSGKFLRPHAPRQKVYFPEGGTVYFQPDASRFRRLRPRVARIAQTYDAFRELERHAPDFSVTAWVVGLHNTRLGYDAPEFTAKNVYGDPLLNSLCPAQPEVRHYLTALCSEAAAQPAVAEIALETPGWQAFRHGHHHEFELIEMPERVEILLGMCFCAACRAGAAADGVDVSGLARNTVAELENFFANGIIPATAPETDPDWTAFLAWRAKTVETLVSEIRTEMPRETKLAVIPTVQTPNELCWIEGSDLKRLAHAANRLEVPAYQCGPSAIQADAARVRATAGPDADIGFILRPTYPHLTDGGQVAQAVRKLRELRPISLSFYNYGHMRLESLDWIRDALA